MDSWKPNDQVIAAQAKIVNMGGELSDGDSLMLIYAMIGLVVEGLEHISKQLQEIEAIT